MGQGIESAVMFRDRIAAGRALAGRLGAYRGKGVLVLGISRGGVPVAAEMARELNGDLDVVVARKLQAPGHPEHAIGAVTADGGRFLNAGIIAELGISDRSLEDVTAKRLDEVRRWERGFRSEHPPAKIRDRIAILVDDGLTTGATLRAAVRSVKKQKPAHLVVAIPVASDDACAILRNEVDEVVCLHVPKSLGAVASFYENFPAVANRDVERILVGPQHGSGASKDRSQLEAGRSVRIRKSRQRTPPRSSPSPSR